jgi:hypothetical protein
MKLCYILSIALLAVSCSKLDTHPVSPVLKPSDTTTSVPENVEKAIQVLLSNGGRHPSPMPTNARKAYETLCSYEKPEEGIGKTKTDGSYYKSHYFRKSKIRKSFYKSPEGVTSNTFYQENNN